MKILYLKLLIDWLIDWFTVMKILYLRYYWPFCAVFLFSLNPRIVVETKVGGERPAPKKKKLKLPEFLKKKDPKKPIRIILVVSK